MLVCQFNDHPFHEYVDVWIAMAGVQEARGSQRSRAGPVNLANCQILHEYVC